MNKAEDASMRQALTDAVGGQYLSFCLGSDLYAIDILRVQEIRGWEPVRALPDMPAHVKGVLDLRGTIVPVVDLRIRFGIPDPAYDPTQVVIIVSLSSADGERHLVGMVVDGVSDVIDTASHEVKPPPRGVAGAQAAYLTGMVSDGDHMIVMMDVDRIFSDEDLARVTGLAGG